jgi:transposase
LEQREALNAMATKPKKPKDPPAKGRPTKYDPAMCETVIELGMLGKSKMQIAAKLGISRETLYEWKKQNKDFSDSIKKSMTFSQTFWEAQGEKGLWGGKEFNATVFCFVMKNRFHEDYKDKHEVEQTSNPFRGVWEAIAANGRAQEEAAKAAAESGSGATFADVAQAIGATGKAAAMAAASEEANDLALRQMRELPCSDYEVAHNMWLYATEIAREPK